MDPLITTDELGGLLDQATLLDVRYRLGGPPGRVDFESGHVPGAAYVDLEQDLAAPPGHGGRHPLPDTAAFEHAMRAVGVRQGRPVVVYDSWAGRAAARCWWLLRHHGHHDVRVLDGGWSAWCADGGAVETVVTTPEVGDFASVLREGDVVDVESVLDVGVLIDARAPERYRGDVEPVDPVAGHIPGAVNVPTDRNLADDGRFRDSTELAKAYAEVGVVPGSDVAVYCGSGVTATHDLIALERIGVRARLYPGSWSGWITDPSRPVARPE